VVRTRSQTGFVLVGSIWLILVMLVVAGLFSAYASSQVEQARKAKLRTLESLDWIATEQTLLYLFAVNDMTRRGLRVETEKPVTVRLDGTVYKGWGDTYFSVNDYGGLVGVNAYGNIHLDQLLNSFEISESNRRELLDGLYDYIDMDDLVRLNGHEAAMVTGSRLKPANDLLKTVPELGQVRGWREFVLSNPEFQPMNWLSTNWRSRLNLNSIPESLLPRVLPITAKEAEQLRKARRVQPFSNMETVNEILGHRVRLVDDYYTFIPTGDVRFRVYSARSNKVSTFVVLYSPMSVRHAWVVDYRYQSESRIDHKTSPRIVAKRYFSREPDPTG